MNNRAGSILLHQDESCELTKMMSIGSLNNFLTKYPSRPGMPINAVMYVTV